MADAGNPELVGKNMSGKGDVTGKLFRDEMIMGALQQGSGWVHYIFTHPSMSGLYPKKSYYRLATGSDGIPYIVICGRYLSCAYLWQSPNASQDRSIEMEMQPDLKILLCGTRNDSVQKDIQILRYLPSGRPDPAFGKSGSVIYAGEAGKDDYAFGITVDDDGRILIAEREHNGHDPDILLLRYTPEGLLDPTFGDNGAVRYSCLGNGTDSARGILVQKSGALLIAGEMNVSTHKEMAALRFNPDGSPDAMFGHNGVFLLNQSGEEDSYGFALASYPGDMTVLTGGAAIGTGMNSSVATIRLTPDGSLDTSFGKNGVALFQGKAGGPDYGNWVHVSPERKILVTGAESDEGGSYDIVTIQYNPDGTLDPTFGAGGIARYGGAGYDYAWGQDIDADGRILIAGTSEVNQTMTPVLIRYTPDGRPDESFGEHGVYTYEAFGPGVFYAVLIDDSGDIYTSGYNTKDGKDISLFVKIPKGDV